MNKTKIAATITLVAMVTNFSASTTSVLAYELSNKDEVTSSISNKIIQAHQSSSANGDDATKESKNNANSLEADIRQSQKILDDWIVDGSISDTMAAFISYPQDKTDHTFSVYVNRPGLSFGYFFRGGGDIVEVDDYIAEFVVEGNNERAFISMNTQNIVRLEVDDGNGIQVIDIDSGKPFAIVLPLNVGNICFYDTNGNVVEYLRQQL